MDRYEIIDDLKNYFCIEELVDEEVYNKHRERAWKFFDTNLLRALLIIRKGLNKPITINNWKWGGRFSQRGLRHNESPMVKKKNRPYLSAHMLGKAIDFDVDGMSADEVRKWIVDNIYLFKYKLRLERNLNGKSISWVHLDTIDEQNNPKIYLFDV